MSWDKLENEIERGHYSATWAIMKWILFVIVIVGILSFVFKQFFLLSKVTQNDAIIYNYEYFHKQSQSYRAILSKIRSAKQSVDQFKQDAGPRESWTFEDKTEYARLNSIATGLVYQCNDLVADYNAKTEMLSRSIFKTNSTPYKLGECQ